MLRANASSSSNGHQTRWRSEIERLGYAYKEVAQYDLSRLSPDRRVQVRESQSSTTGFAPRAEEDRYAVMMGHTAFDPILVTIDEWLVDGNTRVGGCIKRGDKFFPAVIIDVEYEDSDDKTKHELHALGATLNMYGNNLTMRERRDIVLPHLLSLGWTQEQIERSIGIKPNVVRSVKRELAALEKLNEIGINIDDNGNDIKKSSLSALGDSKAVGLHSKPYKELVEFATEAGLNATEIKDFAQQMSVAPSDKAAIAVIEEARQEQVERIHDKTFTGKSKPPAARMLRQHLGFITKHDDPEILVERNPAFMDKHIEAIGKTLELLDNVLTLQREEKEAYEEGSEE